MKEEILNNLLGDMTWGFLVSFYIFALFGVIFSMLAHLGTKVKKTKVKLSFGYWLRDNIVRFLSSVMAIFFVARFAPEFSLPFAVNMAGALKLGLVLDQVIIFFRNKTKINIFQK
jgi:cellulose synthase/poly-beta-1,6-N-acetylglucosamine synthase-like glycosyltransferase